MGASMYWSAIVYLQFESSVEKDAFFAMSSQGVALLCIVAAIALVHRLSSPSHQRVLAVLACAGSLASAVVSSTVAFRGDPGLEVVRVVVAGSSSAFLLLFWGLSFAVLDKKRAERTVLVSVFGCFALYGALMALPSDVASLAAMALRTLSPLPFLVAGAPLQVRDRSFRREAAPQAVAFFLSRAFVGLCLGVLSYAVVARLDSGALPVCGLALTCAAVIVLTVHQKRGGESMPLLVVAPLAMAGAMTLPFASDQAMHFQAFQASAAPVLWFSWIVLSAVQVSEVKESFGMNEAALTFAEKGVKNLFWMGGFLLASALAHFLGEDFIARHIGQFALFSLVAWLSVVSFFLTGLAQAKERGRALDSLPHPEEQMREVCDEMALDFGLSRREAEVLALLAEGHTQARICEILVLSPGTVKSHVSHIYRKLHIHKRESLIALFQEYREKLKAKRRFGY